jgi:ubiquinone biosynthesis protein UbiJ
VDIEKSFGIVRESAGLLQGLVREVGTATSGISAQIGALAAAAKGIDVSSRSMLTVTEKVQVIEREIAEIAANEAKLQVTQRELMQQMQNVWPQLLETVSRSVADSTRQLDQTWAQTSERFRTAVETVNQGFAASVDDLADAVDKLNASKQPPRAQAG